MKRRLFITVSDSKMTRDFIDYLRKRFLNIKLKQICETTFKTKGVGRWMTKIKISSGYVNNLDSPTILILYFQALVEETQHEIVQLEHAHEGDDGILKTLLRDASPFLFPCTIEFSLICAVILFEMWKCVDKRVTNSTKYESSARSLHHLSIDCGSAHR